MRPKTLVLVDLDLGVRPRFYVCAYIAFLKCVRIGKGKDLFCVSTMTVLLQRPHLNLILSQSSISEYHHIGC